MEIYKKLARSFKTERRLEHSVRLLELLRTTASKEETSGAPHGGFATAADKSIRRALRVLRSRSRGDVGVERTAEALRCVAACVFSARSRGG